MNTEHFLPVICHDRLLGYRFTSQQCLFFFGTSFATIENLSEAYPDLSWRRMHQTHGNICAHIRNPRTAEPEADAMWTTEKNLALVVSTADCLPILISFEESIAAIHAGWRGVVSTITLSTLNILKIQRKSHKENGLAVIGPHIRQDSFDFDRIDAGQFLKLATQFELDHHSVIRENSSDKTKVKIGLSEFVRAQISQSGLVQTNHIFELPIDTFSTREFHSYRRERIAGRNLSFVARLDTV